jgi:hypothetical protein
MRRMRDQRERMRRDLATSDAYMWPVRPGKADPAAGPIPGRSLPQDRRTRRLLTGPGASSLGDGMSTVTIAWLAENR